MEKSGNTSFNEAIRLSLETWYPKDNPLHFGLHHPLGKLVGEWGELLDDYMKWRYKPEYGKLAGLPFKPLGELIDVWYYIRILAYQQDISLDENFRNWFSDDQWTDGKPIDFLITCAITKAGVSFTYLHEDGRVATGIMIQTIRQNFTALLKICELSNLTIDQLTKASWEKLKPGSERGDEWMKAPDNVEIWEK